MTCWRYTLALPWFSGKVEADDPSEAGVQAIYDAQEQLSWNSEWWAASDINLEEMTNARDEHEATSS